MQGIATTISIVDQMTAPILTITNSIQGMVNRFNAVEQASDIDTSSFDRISEQVSAAETAAQQFQQTLDNIQPRSIHLDVVPGIGSFDTIINDIAANQERISQQALRMEMISPNAILNIQATKHRIDDLVSTMNGMREIELPEYDSVFIDRINAGYDEMQSRIADAVSVQNQMNAAVEQGDVRGLNAGYRELNGIVEQVEQNVRQNMAAMRELSYIWVSPEPIELFNNTGVERFQSEIQSATGMITQLSSAQNTLLQQAENTRILPPNAIGDITDLNNRIASLHAQTEALSNVQLNDIGAQQANNEIERLRQTLSQAIHLQEQFSSSMGEFDVSGANAAFNQLNSMIDNTERNFRDRINQIQEMDLSNAEWTKPQTIDVIMGNGLARYRQEIQSANALMNDVITTQQQISQQAESMRVLPPNAVHDITGLSSRVAQLQQQLQRVEQNALSDVGANQASAQVEQLRQRLTQANEAQNALNDALQRMDVSAANAAYNRLNSIVDETTRGVRDNEAAQRGFNGAIGEGSAAMGMLTRKIGAAVAAYASIQGIKMALGLSDELANTTARLNMMNDGLQTTQELQDKIYLAAERSRGAYSDTAQVVSKLGLLAGKAFSSNDEIIAFTEQLNKNFVIGGASIQEQASAMHQLTQAMAAGKLQGDEYNSIIENAPLLANAIESYMSGAGAEGTMKEWAAEGLLTAEVIKNALFSVADETNERFEQMPMTFGQVANSIKNQALVQFQPILSKLNEIANSPDFQVFVDNVINAISVVASAAMEIFSLIISIAQFVSDNWSIIEPIIWGVAAAFAAWKLITIALTIQQWFLNAALLANPLTPIIIAIAAVVAVLVIWINKMGGLKVAWLTVVNDLLTKWDWLKIGFMSGVYRILNLWDIMQLGMMTAGTAIANFMGDMKANVLTILQNMVNGAIDIINEFIGILNKIPGVNIGLIEQVTFGVDAQLANDAEKQAREANLTSAREEVEASIAGRAETLDAMRSDALDAMAERLAVIEETRAAADQKNKGVSDGRSSGADPIIDPDIGRSAGNIDANTAKQLEYSEEELKLWRDMTERDAIDKYTLVSVDMGGFTTNNTVSSDMDLDGIVNYIAEQTEEAIYIIAEGVHA